jgi:AhpD family alkylhydroperoxidase
MSSELTTRNREVGRDLGGLARRIPDAMQGLNALHQAATAEGALSSGVKELMATAIAVYAGCEDCVAFHLDRARRAGADDDQILEAFGVAVLMGGGPASVHAARALAELHEAMP